MSTIEFDEPAQAWLECLPLGNGRLGAMLDGAVPTTRIRLNDETAWSGSPSSIPPGGAIGAEDAARRLATARQALAEGDPLAAEEALRSFQVPYSQAYLPFATVVLTRESPETATRYRRILDLGSAVHTTDAGALREETFASAPHGVLVHRITGAREVDVELTSPHQRLRSWNDDGEFGLLVRLPSDVAPGHEPELPAATWSDAPGAAVEGVALVGIRRDADAFLVVVATETTFGRLGEPLEADSRVLAGRARLRVSRALALGWDRLLAAHLADVRPLLGASSVEVGEPPRATDGEAVTTDARLARAEADSRGPIAADPGLVGLLFDVGRYLLVASSRPGTLPSTLQGIWNDDLRPPWSSNYTLNINTQMNHWSAHVTGLSECAEPLHDFIRALAVPGAQTAERLYGARGWVAHHNSDAWLLTDPVGAGHGDARWTAWPMASLWLVTHIADAVRYGAVSDERLRELWPAVRGAAEFAHDWVRPDGHGGWTTAPATSPENAYLVAGGAAAVDTTTAMDLTLVRAASSAAVIVADRLGMPHDAVATASRSLLEQLPREPAVGVDGAIVEWSGSREAEDPHHRHVSHLVGLYPGVEPWTDAAREAAARTLTRRGDESSGWSLVWKAILWARLGRGDRASDVMSLLFRRADRLEGPWAGGLYPNLFAAHPPFQIDANLGFPALVAELLVQSHDGIELLPALPPALATGTARGLVARPGVEVDLAWRDGALERVHLRARTGVEPGSLRIRWAGVELERTLPAGGALTLERADFAEQLQRGR